MVKVICSIKYRQKMTADRDMLKFGIAVIELRTVSVRQETGQIVIQLEYVTGMKGWFQRLDSRFDEAFQ